MIGGRQRVLVAARLGWAATLTVYARSRRRGPRADRRVEVYAARALAAREVVEAVATAAQRDGRPPHWSSVVDALHAASMVPVAIASPRLRRDALTSAAAAALLALLSG